MNLKSWMTCPVRLVEIKLKLELQQT